MIGKIPSHIPSPLDNGLLIDGNRSESVKQDLTASPAHAFQPHQIFTLTSPKPP